MKTWKIRGLALTACLAFVTTTCESKNDGVAGRRPTMTVALTEADGRGGTDDGGVSYGIDDAASKTVYKSEARESDRRDTSDNERSDWKSGKKNESGKKDKSDRKHESEKEGKPKQKDKSREKGGSGRRGNGKTGSGSSERSASRSYYFDDDNDEIVTPDGIFIGKDNPVTVVKTHNGATHISSSGGIVRVEGDIKEAGVYGSDVGVVADLAVKVRILGSDVDVFVRSISSVHFDGSGNDVHWTNGPMPSVTDNGVENRVRRARSVPAR